MQLVYAKEWCAVNWVVRTLDELRSHETGDVTEQFDVEAEMVDGKRRREKQ